MLQVCLQLILSGHLYHSVPSHIPPQLRLPWVPLRADPHRVLSTAIKLCGQGALTWLRGRYIDAREGQNPTNPALLPVRAGRGRSRPDRPQPPLEPSEPSEPSAAPAAGLRSGAVPSGLPARPNSRAGRAPPPRDGHEAPSGAGSASLSSGKRP